MGALTTPRSQYRGRRPLAYLFPQLWYPVLPLLALGASLKPWHLSFLLTRVFCRPVGQAAALQPQGLVSARGLGVGEKQTFELLRQLAFPLDSFPGAETWGLGRHISPPTHPTPGPPCLGDTDALAWQERNCADTLHHEGLCPALTRDTNVIKSVFKLDNILDNLAEMPEHEKLLPSCCASPNSNSRAI